MEPALRGETGDGKDPVLRVAPVRDVRHHLLELHRALVDAERQEYERPRGRLSDGDFLDALINDPAFSWLGSLTALIVRLDELLEEEPAQPASLADCVAQIRKLLKPDAGGSDFQRRYADLLQRSPAVGVAHGNTVRALRAYGPNPGTHILAPDRNHGPD
jgi:hypothetical protein